MKTIFKPEVRTREEFRQWISEWRIFYKEISLEIRADKITLKKLMKGYLPEKYSKFQSHLKKHKRLFASKLMQLRQEVTEEWVKKQNGLKQLELEMSQYPIELENCDRITFHYNKGNLTNPAIPPWILKTKGRTFYCNQVTSNAPWTTKETPDHITTKGSIRIKKGDILIDKDGKAIINSVS